MPTTGNPDLAPEGHCVVSILAHYVPYDLAGGWTDAQREQLGETALDGLERYAPSIRQSLVAREVLTPPDLERRYAVTQGHVHHGEHSLDQLLVRPCPECAGHKTPVRGLFLCGGGSRPGGGLTCAPGAAAASVILS